MRLYSRFPVLKACRLQGGRVALPGNSRDRPFLSCIAVGRRRQAWKIGTHCPLSTSILSRHKQVCVVNRWSRSEVCRRSEFAVRPEPPDQELEASQDQYLKRALKHFEPRLSSGRPSTLDTLSLYERNIDKRRAVDVSWQPIT